MSIEKSVLIIVTGFSNAAKIEPRLVFARMCLFRWPIFCSLSPNTLYSGMQMYKSYRLSWIATAVAMLVIILEAFSISLLKPSVLSAKVVPAKPSTIESKSPRSAIERSQTARSYNTAKSPLYFEENIGQEPEHVLFTSITPNYKLALYKNRMDLMVSSDLQDQAGFSHLHIIPQGINLDARVHGIKPLPSYSNYFTGSKRSQWLTDAKHYAGIRYESVYPGIDLDFYGNSKEIEYDFIVSPGADPGKIRLAFAGLENLTLDTRGNAILQFQGGELVQKRPYVYQEINGQHLEVAAEYKVLESDTSSRTPQLGFSISALEYKPSANN